jgi:Uma2 family endonuclease
MITQTRMTVREFMALPESSDHVELIAGEVVVSPTPKFKHQNIAGNSYVTLKNLPQGITAISPMDVHLDDENVVQPDVFWVSGADSLCKLGDDGYWHGAPDLVVEVLSPSTALRDHGVKFALYERFGTREYWLIDPEGEFVEVFHREGEMFRRFGVFGRDEAFALSVLPDVTVQVSALFAG